MSNFQKTFYQLIGGGEAHKFDKQTAINLYKLLGASIGIFPLESFYWDNTYILYRL